MWRLHIPVSLSAPLAGGGVSILVGQRCCSTLVAEEAPCTVCALASRVPCADASVAEEQVECLERVLPFGIDVLGFAGDAAALASLAAQSPELKKRELIELVLPGSADRQKPACRVFGAPARRVELVEAEVAFVEARCVLHTDDGTMPLLVSWPGALPMVVDGESDRPLLEPRFSSPNGLELVQTGAPSSTLRIHVVISPSLVSASGLYRTLFRQIRAAVAAGTTRLVELNSHNAHLHYCCRLEPGPAHASVDSSLVTKGELAEVLEVMEDATGTRVSRSDVRALAPLHLPKNPIVASEDKARDAQPSWFSAFSHLLFGLVGLIVAIVVLVRVS
ncbi:hypothetical protein NESM_000249000 [Novymonas esmeraldas]|uniref:Uncharacterized protein n=1 Tax=Novymonas esmeraldas TaxID=1808958 RepID=A0AAW0F9S5_9TRYP